MTWEKVAEAQVSSQGVQGDISVSLSEVPKGTQGYIQLHGFGIGPIFDAAGVELVVQEVMDAHGIDLTVIDCYGRGLSDGYIQFEGSPFALVPLLWAVASVLAALGVFLVIITVAVLIWKAAGPGGPGGIGAGLTLLLVASAALGGIYLWGRRNR